MTKEELWDIIIERNPSFAEGPVKMTAERFRKLYDLVWDTASEHAWNTAGDVRSADLPPGFEKIFGGMK